MAARLAVPVPATRELEREKSAAEEQEHGNVCDDAYENERESGWAEQKQARANEQDRVKESEAGPERGQARGKEQAWEQGP